VPRIKLTPAYVGTRYSGWQIQEKPDPPPTIQGEIERALAKVCGVPVRVHGAGRTDAGVHADGQAAHCDVPDSPRGVNWPAALNVRLPPDIRILDAREVEPSFHACFSALSKTYRYDLRLSRRPEPPRLRDFVWSCGPLDMDALDAALPLLTGGHDFKSLQNRGTDVRDTARTVFSLRRGPSPLAGLLPESGEAEELVSIHVRADGFLKQMARNMVGLLVAVGRGRFDPARIPELLAARDRAPAPAGAPARGLTLVKVEYARAEAFRGASGERPGA
jgi:tRNA pseudouridine38-40 synthase